MHSDSMKHISRRLISTIVLVFISTLFFTLFASARTAINASSPPVIRCTREIRSAESTSKTDKPRSQAIRQYLADIFGVPDFKTSWYDNIIEVEVTGDTATIKTNLSSGDEKIINLCGVVSGFIYSHLNVQLGIRKLKILGSSGEVLVFRRGVLDDCPYKSSRNVERNYLELGILLHDAETALRADPEDGEKRVRVHHCKNRLEDLERQHPWISSGYAREIGLWAPPAG
jgi:hypothetical protein